MFINKKVFNILFIHMVVILYTCITSLLFNFSVDFLKINTIIVYSWCVFSFMYCGEKIFHPYILFLVAFFVFILGRIFLDILGLSDFAQTIWFTVHVFSENIQKEILETITLSLVCLHCGALFALGILSNKDVNYSTWHNKELIKKIGFFLFFISVIPYFLNVLVQVLYVFKHGYVSLYSAKELIVQNPILRIFDDFYKIGFFLYLATLPSKKEIRIPVIIYCTILGLTLLIGRRGTVFTEILTIIAYFGLRDEIKFKRFAFIVLSLIPLALVVQIIRSSGDLNTFDANPKEVLENFIFEQGGSSKILGYTFEFEKELDGGLKYLFDPVVVGLKNGTFGRMLLKPVPVGQSLEVINSRYSLAHMISYKANPDIYLSGNGLGTSFVAEFYIAGRYWGVALLSFIMFFGFVYFIGRYKYSVVGIFLLLYIMPNIFFMPRAHPLDFVNFLIRPIIFLVVLQILFPVKKGWIK